MDTAVRLAGIGNRIREQGSYVDLIRQADRDRADKVPPRLAVNAIRIPSTESPHVYREKSPFVRAGRQDPNRFDAPQGQQGRRWGANHIPPHGKRGRSQMSIGGAGGAAAVGGDGMDGGCSVGTVILFGQPDSSSATINGGRLVDYNQVIGGAGCQGASGGNGKGGGVVVLSGRSAALSNSIITQNCALGGTARAGGTDGGGYGGGLYIDVGAVVTATNTKIKKNTASTAGNDIYGTLS